MLSQLIVSADPTTNLETVKQILQKIYPSDNFSITNNPDCIFIDPQPDETIKIKQIRDLTAELSIKPIKHQYKIAILQHANQITVPAQHAFLKTLEEPPEQVTIFLLTNSEQSLLSTIRSRCQITKPLSVTTDITNSILITELLDAKPIHRLRNVVNYKNRDQASALIKNLLQQIHQQICQKPQPDQAHTLRILLETQKALHQNAHVQLTLDQCLLKL